MNRAPTLGDLRFAAAQMIDAHCATPALRDAMVARLKPKGGPDGHPMNAFAGIGGSPGSFAASAGLPSEATILAGLADFLVDRAKDELVISFLQALSEDTQLKKALTVFAPAAFDVVSNAESYSAKGATSALRSALRNDLDRLPLRILDTLAVANSGELAKHRAEIALARGALLVTLRLRDGGSAPSALATLRELRCLRGKADEVCSTARLIGVVADEYVRAADSVRAVLADPERAELFIRFLVSELVAQGDGDDVAAWAAGLSSWVTAHADVLDRLLTQLGNVQASIESMDASIQQGVNTPALQAQRNALVAQLGTVALLAVELASGDGQASLSAGQQDQLRATARAFLALADAVAAREYDRAVVTLTRDVAPLIDSLFGKDLLGPNTRRLLGFAAALAQAKTPEEVSAAIAAVAEPVGSFRSKRSRPGSTHAFLFATINAYVGLGYGNEVAIGGSAPSRGAVAPVASLGFEVGFGRICGCAQSLSVYVPIIDLGAIAATRFSADKDTVASASRASFREVVAPGLYLMWGPWGRVPVSVGAGAQIFPSLRSKTDGSALSVVRWGVLAAVDIPLLRF